MHYSIATAALILGASAGVVGAFADEKQNHQGGEQHGKAHSKARPDASQAEVAPGFRAEVVLEGLTYPTSVENDGAGGLYVAEAGYSYGDPTAIPRILHVSKEGEIHEVAREGLNGPITDLLWHDEKLFIAHRGKISVLTGKNTVDDIVTGLPSEGDHHNNQMTVGPDGLLYFGQGTVTNSGVVGVDNFEMGWLKKHPSVYDKPHRDIEIAAEPFVSKNPLEGENQSTKTSAFHAFTKAAEAGSSVQGTDKPNGVIYRMRGNGEALEVYASGFRNPFGLVWTSTGKLYVTENGLDVRGSRPIANDKEDLYEVKQGGWYGWPDYGSGIPVTDPQFAPPHGPAPQFLLAEHPPVEKPVMTFPKHSAACKIEANPSGAFGESEELFIAFFGHMTPMTGTPGEHGGHRVLRVDPGAGSEVVFFTAKESGHGGHSGNGGSHHDDGGKQTKVSESKENSRVKRVGSQRLVDVRFSTDGGALYICDFGEMNIETKPKPVAGTGVVWRVLPEGAESQGSPTGLQVNSQN